jgi:hypothetical protein
MNGRPTASRWARVLTLSAALTLAGATTAVAQGTDDQEGRESPPLALALSVVLPGAGQVYNGHYLKAAVMCGGAALTAGPIILTASDVLGLDDDTSGTAVHILGAAGVGLILWSWIDAPLSAKAINRRLDAGRLAVEIGPRIDRWGQGFGLSLLRIGF